jgi:hypothetical protein
LLSRREYHPADFKELLFAQASVKVVMKVKQTDTEIAVERAQQCGFMLERTGLHYGVTEDDHLFIDFARAPRESNIFNPF